MVDRTLFESRGFEISSEFKIQYFQSPTIVCLFETNEHDYEVGILSLMIEQFYNLDSTSSYVNLSVSN